MYIKSVFVMLDTISLTYNISDEDLENAKKFFDYSVTRIGDSVYEKYFLNHTFNYDIIERENDIAKFNELKITGSVAKALRGDNINNYTYNLSDLANMTQIIEDETHTKLKHLNFINRIDVGINTELDTMKVINSVQNVNSRVKARLYDSSLLLRNTQRQFIIYDKAEEQKKKDLTVCRFEARLFKNKNCRKSFKDIEDVFDFEKQLSTFNNELNRNFKFERMNTVKNEANLTDVRYIYELREALREHKTLQNYRKYLINKMNINRTSVYRHIKKLSQYLYDIEKENFENINDAIEEEIRKLKK